MMNVSSLSLLAAILAAVLFPARAQQNNFTAKDSLSSFHLYSTSSGSYQARLSPAAITSPNKFRQIDRKRLYLVSGITGLTMAGVYAAHIKPWWSGEKSGFRFKFDFYENYWLEMDKFGHFYANIQAAKVSAAAFQLAGVSRKSSLWIGFMSSTILYTGFELTDAGFEDWGFSVPDQIANLLGAAYPLAQAYYPALQHFNVKISYWPSRYFRSSEYRNTPGFIRYQPYEYVAGDYDGMIFWLSADINWLLPGAIKSLWPDWLNIAMGYSAANLPQANLKLKVRHLYVALDYNMTYLPGNSPFLQKVKSILNAVHFPAPAIKFTPSGAVAFLLHY